VPTPGKALNQCVWSRGHSIRGRPRRLGRDQNVAFGDVGRNSRMPPGVVEGGEPGEGGRS
jgi:hypothetical protein